MSSPLQPSQAHLSDTGAWKSKGDLGSPTSEASLVNLHRLLEPIGDISPVTFEAECCVFHAKANTDSTACGGTGVRLERNAQQDH
jgi:hypothetical protein